MEIIKNYLEAIFKNLPQTEEVQRARVELYSMMEDKYNELKAEGKSENEAIGVVISEFGNLEELAEELGINSYIHVETKKKDDKENVKEGKIVSLDMAKEFINAQVKFSYIISLGVMLCICSPTILLLMDGMYAYGGPSALGISAFIIMIAVAVSIFIYSGILNQKYEWFHKERLHLSYNCEIYVNEEKEKFRPQFAVRIIAGVIMCAVSVLPPIISDDLFGDNPFFSSISNSMLFFIVAIAVYIFITTGLKREVYHILLQEGDYREDKKESNKIVDIIASVYWPIVLCIYLLWSFSTGTWGTTWIIWPIAGILFGAVAAVCNAIKGIKGL